MLVFPPPQGWFILASRRLGDLPDKSSTIPGPRPSQATHETVHVDI